MGAVSGKNMQLNSVGLETYQIEHTQLSDIDLTSQRPIHPVQTQNGESVLFPLNPLIVSPALLPHVVTLLFMM